MILPKYLFTVQVTLGTNDFGPMLLTELLLPKLKESAPSRIVNLGSPGEQFSGGVYWDDLKCALLTRGLMCCQLQLLLHTGAQPN